MCDSSRALSQVRELRHARALFLLLQVVEQLYFKPLADVETHFAGRVDLDKLRTMPNPELRYDEQQACAASPSLFHDKTDIQVEVWRVQ